jgi:hypothetical protein
MPVGRAPILKGRRILVMTSGKYNGRCYHAYAQEVSIYDQDGKIGDRHYFGSFSMDWKPFVNVEYGPVQ